MIVNSAKEYRKWIKIQEDRLEVDEDFIGCSFEKNGRKIKGFFNGVIKLVAKIFELWLSDKDIADLGEDNSNVNTIIDEMENVFNAFKK